MSDRVQAEIHHGDANVTEVVRESDAPAEKMDVGTALDQLVAQRKAEHPEWYQEEQLETTDEPTSQEAAPAEEEPEQETAPDEQAGGEAHTDQEPESKALKRIIQREAKLREDKEAFEAKEAEYQAKLQEYEQAKQLAAVDPISYLKTLGFSQENLIDLAKAAYYESLGDQAPTEYRGQKESLALKREVEALKARLEAKEKQPEAAPNEALAAYQNELLETTKSFDPGQYPSVAKIVDSYSEMTVAADMLAVAQEYAERKGGMGAPLTPEQCLAEVEQRYQEMLSKLSPQVAEQTPAKQEAKKPAKRNTTLSNSMSSNVPPERAMTEDMTYDEIKELARSRFFRTLGED